MMEGGGEGGGDCEIVRLRECPPLHCGPAQHWRSERSQLVPGHGASRGCETAESDGTQH